MSYSVTRYRVRDFVKWKSIFDEREGVRRDAGSKGSRVYRGASDPSEVVIVLEWDDLSKARQYVNSADLKQAIEKGGVVEGTTEIVYFDRWEDQRA